MNNKFEWNRFCKVIAKDFRNIGPMFGTTMIILAALPFAVWLFMTVLGGSNNQMPPDIRLVMIEAMAYVAAIMAPSRMYRTWNLRNDGIYYAMLPASKLEKFCSALLFSLVVCPLAVYLGGMVLDIFLTALPFGPWEDWIWQGKMGFPFTFDLSVLNEMAANEEAGDMFLHFGTLYNVGCWVGYICTVLMFLFTSTLFKRHKVLQTILWIYVIEFVLSIILMPVMISLAGNTDFMEIIYNYFTTAPKQALDRILWWGIAFNILLTVLFGWLSWRRLNRMPY